MKWVNDYLTTVKYVDGGRGPVEFDCWGLVREARYLHCDKALLPSRGEIRNTDPRAFTRAYEAEAAHMEVCEPEHGAIAAVFSGRICVHVGLVFDGGAGRLEVLEVNPHRRVNVLRVVDFEAQYAKVVYYRD